MRKITVMLVVLGLLVYACGYHEGVIQKAERSYLMFTGNWQSTLIQIDEGRPFPLSSIKETQEGHKPNQVLYQVAPGKHRLRVFRDGRLIVNRILFLEDQGTMEVIIP